MTPFEMIAWVKYRTPIGEWWVIGKVGASDKEASIYLDAFYLGQCFAFPFPDKPFPYLHGGLEAFEGHWMDAQGQKHPNWMRCGYIWSHEVDASDIRGEVGNKLYGMRIDALPLHLNKRGKIVLRVTNE